MSGVQHCNMCLSPTCSDCMRTCICKSHFCNECACISPCDGHGGCGIVICSDCARSHVYEYHDGSTPEPEENKKILDNCKCEQCVSTRSWKKK